MALTRALERLAAPPPDNPVYGLLVRTSRRHFHGMRDATLLFLVALAVVSAALVPLYVFSFPVWFGILFGHLLLPSVHLAREMRDACMAEMIFASPLTSADFTAALAAFLRLTTLFCAVPYLCFWASLVALRLTVFRGELAALSLASMSAHALLLFAEFLLSLRFAYWLLLVRPSAVLSAAVLAPVVFMLLRHGTDLRLSIAPLVRHTPLQWLALAGYLAALWLTGELCRRLTSRRFAERARRRLFP